MPVELLDDGERGDDPVPGPVVGGEDLALELERRTGSGDIPPGSGTASASERSTKPAAAW